MQEGHARGTNVLGTLKVFLGSILIVVENLKKKFKILLQAPKN